MYTFTIRIHLQIISKRWILNFLSPAVYLTITDKLKMIRNEPQTDLRHCMPVLMGVYF